jgi:hypothetical protein
MLSMGGLSFVGYSLALSLGTHAAGLAAEPAYDTYGALLARYVTVTGVRYEAWRFKPGDVKALGDVVDRMSQVDLKTLRPEEQYALYINLYNAKVLQIVLDGHPGRSIKDLSKGLNPFEIFKRKVLDFEGTSISLTRLESRLREESQDPRVHFAVNCASRSCPPIALQPYRGATLETMLDRATRDFLGSPGAVQMERTSSWFGGPTLRIKVSKIFDWYADDFSDAGGVAAFLETHASSEVASAVRDAEGKVKFHYHPYDWSLNDDVVTD